MRVSILIYLMGFALILVLLFVMTQGLVVSQCLVRVVDLVGTVEVQPKGEASWIPLTLGKLVKAGDIVRTGPDSEVNLAWVGGTHVRLDPNTEFKLIMARTNNKDRRTASEVSVSLGKIWVKLRKSLKESSKFEVKTPTIVAAVRGTIFSVEVAPDGTTTVETFEGEVGVKQGRQGSIVGRKVVAVYSPNEESGEATRMSEEQIKAWAEKWSVVGAFLSIQKPKEGEHVSGPLVVVSGYTEPGNTVNVNGVEVAPDREGRWSARATVKQGENLITVHAVDADGRDRTIVRKVTY
ncbi:MAG: hypothetical protein GTO55_05100 [Armatimonadetes bacterium]|nr:hypothetical protein [Armatimonadota bacterium]NIM23644.1 hypothetical protein [Armatimonadota bacterium]NIM67511.1 hypothetical protein [Armatimonadota bacterium]NIM76007.1 hypothetical protein [Armatimonadota bacterium]NIN05696.1 hypothetical protein [Armatimonadota bacterium]